MSEVVKEAPAAEEPFTPIFILGLGKDEKTYLTAIPGYSFRCTPVVVGGFMSLVLDWFVNHVPENKQLDFEKVILATFQKMCESRHSYIDKVGDDK